MHRSSWVEVECSGAEGSWDGMQVGFQSYFWTSIHVHMILRKKLKQETVEYVWYKILKKLSVMFAFPNFIKTGKETQTLRNNEGFLPYWSNLETLILNQLWSRSKAGVQLTLKPEKTVYNWSSVAGHERAGAEIKCPACLLTLNTSLKSGVILVESGVTVMYVFVCVCVTARSAVCLWWWTQRPGPCWRHWYTPTDRPSTPSTASPTERRV